ncbi:MAG TPA: substrate binding domain-containing protein, partial [Polyangiales bacterium]|nr:substrate binding domain-containing protein [Polyangiales bacterium]
IDFISRFARSHPEIRLDLSITNEFVDLVRSGVDVAIRMGELEDASVIVRRLGVSRRMLVAAPSYLKQRRKPRTVPELAQHDCVLFAKTETADWQLYRGKRRAKVRVRGSLSANNFDTVVELALRGHGVALVPSAYALAGLADGTLTRILPEWSSGPIPVHAVYLARKFVPRRLQTFLSELTRWENFAWRKEAS